MKDKKSRLNAVPKDASNKSWTQAKYMTHGGDTLTTECLFSEDQWAGLTVGQEFNSQWDDRPKNIP